MGRYSSSMPPSRGGDPDARRRRDQARLTARASRVIVTPVEPPLHHPLSKRDIQRVLSVLPPESTENLRSVSLLGPLSTRDGYPVLVSYRRHGFIRLHALPAGPWRIGPLRPSLVADLRRYGALVETNPTGTLLVWPRGTLRLYCALCALMPGVSRHRREQEGLIETHVQVRAIDTETEPWLVSDLALHQWADFLRDTTSEAHARA